jgi:carboxylesterase
MGRLLHRAGFSVHMPRIPGYSMETECTGFQDWIEEVERIFWTLKRRYRSVSVAGLSSGAALTLALAEAIPEVMSIALWSVTMRYDGWAIPAHRWLLEPCYRLGIGRDWSYEERPPFGVKNERWRARIAEAMRTMDVSMAGPARIPADFIYQAARLGRHAGHHLSRVRADTLIIHAADDETASPRNAQLVYSGIRSEHKRKLMLGDSYHLITFDNERSLVARETIRFFQQSIMWHFPDERLKLPSTARAVLRNHRRHAPGKIA